MFFLYFLSSMNEYLKKNTVPSTIFPKLLFKHSLEIKENPESETLCYQQAHEIYMYEFFKNCKLECKSEITINKVKGIAICPILLRSFTLISRVDEEGFFKILTKAPLPFVFIPYGKVCQNLNLCNGAFDFRESEKVGILMNLEFAGNVGVDFLATPFLIEKEAFNVYIGIVYCN
jgi:hypothetical protein